MAERLKECGWRRSKIGGNLRKRLASRFHIPLHIGKARTFGSVDAFLLW
jgi:hypothetical protein